MQYQNQFKEMNLNVPSLLLGGLAGLTAGSGAAYLVLRHRMALRFSTALDEEVAAVKAHYNSRLKDALSGAFSAMPEAGSPFVGRHGDRFDLVRQESDDELGEAALGSPGDDAGDLAEGSRVDDFSITDPLEGLDDGEEDTEETGDAEAPSYPPVNRDLRGPYLISLAEFVDPPPGWQQITITYFAEDKVMVDEKNDPIPNFRKITGPIRGPQDFGGISEDPHLRYVRNQVMDADFEIVLDRRSYAEGVLHYGQPNREH